MSTAAPRNGFLGTLGWAAYLACSWTWCIGMFLPVLLVRDYGVWGFVVFAVPNVIGAAAMGWVLWDGASQELRTRHGPAITLFSYITVLFHAFFACWISKAFSHDSFGLVFFTAALLACGVFALDRDRVSAAAALLISLAAGAALFSGGATSHNAQAMYGTAPDLAGLVALMPVVVFGFVACPYLDATFLRARTEQSVRKARRSFTLGFGVFFSAMIGLTLAYAGVLLSAPGDPTGTFGAWIRVALLAHITVQTALTVALHVREARLARAGSRVLVLLFGVFLAYLAQFGAGEWRIAGSSMTQGEVIYRIFMSFYGLLFPAYVWLCMIPTRAAGGGTHAGIDGRAGRRKLLILALAVLAAAPMYWLGFIERREIWLIPGLGVVLFARVFLPGGPAIARSNSPVEETASSTQPPASAT